MLERIATASASEGEHSLYRDGSDIHENNRLSIGSESSFPIEMVVLPAGGFYRRRGKRLFDIVVATLMLILLSPVILLLALSIGLDGGWPFFGHTRIGRSGTFFKCYKLRTMVMGAETRLSMILATDPDAAAEWARVRKLSNDPRITRLGSLLRATSIDELPQLWNVIKGDMSLVGPRPVTFGELEYYGEQAGDYLSMRPGLTGPWQVGFRNEVSFATRAQVDTDYSRSYCFLNDMGIALRTVGVVCRRTGC